MKAISNIEREVNQIRLKIYEETKHLTSEQYKERLKKITNEASKKYGFKVITSAETKITAAPGDGSAKMSITG